MTARCSAPVVWGDYGDEKGFFQFQLTERNIAWSNNDDLKTLKAKWQGREAKPAKFKAPNGLSPSKTGVGLPKGTPYAYNPDTGAYLKAGYGGVYTGSVNAAIGGKGGIIHFK